MSTLRDLALLQQQRLDRKEDKPPLLRATLVSQRNSAGQDSMHVEGRPYPFYVWVRVWSADGNILPAYNGVGVPVVEDMPVYVTRSRGVADVLEIVDVDRELLEYAGDLTEGFAVVQPHAQAHEWPDRSPGFQAITIYPRAWSQLRTYPTNPSSLSVTVSPMRYQTAATMEVFNGADIDLTASVPGAANQARLVLVYLDATTNTLGITNGALGTDADGWSLGEPVLANGQYPSVVVRLENGQTDINEDDISDRRLFLNSSPGTISNNVSWANVIVVAQSGGDYTTIQDAVNAATTGTDLILICPGTYAGFTTTKSLTFSSLAMPAGDYLSQYNMVQINSACTFNRSSGQFRVFGLRFQTNVTVNGTTVNFTAHNCQIQGSVLAGAASTPGWVNLVQSRVGGDVDGSAAGTGWYVLLEDTVVSGDVITSNDTAYIYQSYVSGDVDIGAATLYTWFAEISGTITAGTYSSFYLNALRDLYAVGGAKAEFSDGELRLPIDTDFSKISVEGDVVERSDLDAVWFNDASENRMLVDHLNAGDMLFRPRSEVDGLLLLDFQRWEQYGDGANRANYINGSRHEQCRVGAASDNSEDRGALHFEPGRWHSKRGLVIEEATTNYCSDPCMRDGNGDGQADGWSYWDNFGSGGNATRTVELHPDERKGWLQVAAYTAAVGDVADAMSIYFDTAVGSFAPGDDAAFSLDCIIENLTGCAIRLAISAYNAVGAWIADTVVDFSGLTSRITRLSMVATNLPANTSYVRGQFVVRLVDNGDSFTVKFGAVNIEKKAYPTTFCWGGGGEGYQWSGAPHTTTSSRTATYVMLDDYVDLIDQNNFYSIRTVFQAPYAAGGTWPSSTFIFDIWGGAAANRLYLEYDDATDVFRVYINGAFRLTSAAQTFEAGEWLDVVITCDYFNDEYALYVNGILEDTDTTVLTAPVVTDWVIGQNYLLNAHWCNCIFAEYAVYGIVLNYAEVAAMYALQRPTVDATFPPSENRPTVPGVSAGVWDLMVNWSGAISSNTYVEVTRPIVFSNITLSRRTFAGAWVCGSIFFDAGLYIDWTGTTAYAKLQYYDVATAAWRDVPDSEVSLLGVGAPNWDRVRSGPLCIPEQECEYRIMVRTDDPLAFDNMYLLHAQILVAPGAEEDL